MRTQIGQGFFCPVGFNFLSIHPYFNRSFLRANPNSTCLKHMVAPANQKLITLGIEFVGIFALSEFLIRT